MGRPNFRKRNKPFKQQLPVFYIYSEGKNTEPEYFNSIRLDTLKIKVIGLGANTISLVKDAAKHLKKEDFDKQRDQKWCVFDKDDFNADQFDNTIHKAESKGFKVAWSNQSFEYWFVLHFEDHQGSAIDRTDYRDKINQYITNEKAKYNLDGNKHVTEGFFQELCGIDQFTRKRRIDLAIKRAKRIHDSKKDSPPWTSESCTTVYELIESIMQYGKIL